MKHHGQELGSAVVYFLSFIGAGLALAAIVKVLLGLLW
jgi:hypothetical protein